MIAETVLLDLMPKYRLRSGKNCSIASRGFVGYIVAFRRHESNQRLMYLLSFYLPEHQKLFGVTFFYADDLEPVTC